ncbi:MAG: NADH-quinone oxidoreductase subunit NuoH [Nitrososphaerota archaeon]|nr:NADH-quinone oxidoreductase subunit NuoH [Nitrososphaerota archaeon]
MDDYSRPFFRAIAVTSLLVTATALYLLKGDIMNALEVLLTDPLAITATGLFRALVFPGLLFISVVPLMAEWVERKFVARVQVRVGPLYVGGPEGLLQPVADMFKLLFKEIIIPKNADRPIFLMAPVFAFVLGALPTIVIPYSPSMVIWNYGYGVLLFFAILAFFPLDVLLAAWSSNNKYSFIGGLRALYQQASYEIPIFLSALPAVMLAGSFRLADIAQAQSKVWFVFLAPVSAAVFFVSMLAEMERIPFDMPEADSELVSGWTTEYSGMAWGLYQFSIYVKMLAFAGIFVVFFLGGWTGPPVLPAVAWSLVKVSVVILVLLSTRAFWPRIRIDQLIRAGWGRLIPLAILNILLLVLFQHYLPGVVG